MKLITIVFCAAIACLCFGCDKDESAPPDNTRAKPVDPVKEAFGYGIGVAACSDGTIYVADGSSEKAIWLVNGKAVEITIDDTIDSLSTATADFNGGVYVVGDSRIWYLKSGRATPVTMVSVSAIRPEEHEITAQSLNWAALTTYGQNRISEEFGAGFEEGMREGIDSLRK